MSEPTQGSMLEAQLKDMKDAGLPVHTGVRTYHDNSGKKNDAFNSKVLRYLLPTWIKNSAANYAGISGGPSMEWLKHSAKGLPVVACGIGPSLDEHIPIIKKARPNIILLATDAAVKPLLAAGIRPDLVVSFDPKKEQWTMFEGLHDLAQGIPLLVNSCTHPMTLAFWPGPKMYFNMLHPGVEFMDVVLPTQFPEFWQLPNKGTVGNLAMLVAREMGAKSLLLCGMDLCYAKDGESWRYRCKDYHYREANAAQGLPARFEEKVNETLYNNADRLAHTYDVKIKGKEFKVDEPLDKYRLMAVQTIGVMNEVDVVDCAPNGVLSAEGVRHMTLQDALDEMAPRGIEPGEAVILHLPRLLPRAQDAKSA
jgi:uncharacterized Rossmann fold enzyme